MRSGHPASGPAPLPLADDRSSVTDAARPFTLRTTVLLSPRGAPDRCGRSPCGPRSCHPGASRPLRTITLRTTVLPLTRGAAERCGRSPADDSTRGRGTLGRSPCGAGPATPGGPRCGRSPCGRRSCHSRGASTLRTVTVRPTVLQPPGAAVRPLRTVSLRTPPPPRPATADDRPSGGMPVTAGRILPLRTITLRTAVLPLTPVRPDRCGRSPCGRRSCPGRRGAPEVLRTVTLRAAVLPVRADPRTLRTLTCGRRSCHWGRSPVGRSPRGVPGRWGRSPEERRPCQPPRSSRAAPPRPAGVPFRSP